MHRQRDTSTFLPSAIRAALLQPECAHRSGGYPRPASSAQVGRVLTRRQRVPGIAGLGSGLLCTDGFVVFRVKICGITRPEDAIAACDAGADAIGLNFYAKSSRYLPADRLVEMCEAAEDVNVVGVFVNSPAAEINRLAGSGPLDLIQLHGDEPPELLNDLMPEVPVIRALRMGEDGLRPAAEWIGAAVRLGRPLAAVLIDAAGATGEYGGTGRTADWSRIAEERHLLGDTPMILAGGLTPENVAEAILAAGAEGVDTASGVESAPGIKDAAQIAAFVERATARFAS